MSENFVYVLGDQKLEQIIILLVISNTLYGWNFIE